MRIELIKAVSGTKPGEGYNWAGEATETEVHCAVIGHLLLCSLTTLEETELYYDDYETVEDMKETYKVTTQVLDVDMGDEFSELCYTSYKTENNGLLLLFDGMAILGEPQRDGIQVFCKEGLTLEDARAKWSLDELIKMDEHDIHLDNMGKLAIWAEKLTYSCWEDLDQNPGEQLDVDRLDYVEGIYRDLRQGKDLANSISGLKDALEDALSYYRDELESESCNREFCLDNIRYAEMHLAEYRALLKEAADIMGGNQAAPAMVT